jgi:hypothetical protein
MARTKSRILRYPVALLLALVVVISVSIFFPIHEQPSAMVLETSDGGFSHPEGVLRNQGSNPIFFTGNSRGRPQLVIEYKCDGRWVTVEENGFPSEGIPLRPHCSSRASIVIPANAELWRAGAEVWQPSSPCAFLSKLSLWRLPEKIRELSFRYSRPERLIVWSAVVTNGPSDRPKSSPPSEKP